MEPDPPDKIRTKIFEMALDFPEESCRGLAHKMTDERVYYIPKSSVYRIPKSYGMFASTVFDAMAASKDYRNKTTRVHQMWQTNFTYLTMMGWDGTINPQFWTIKGIISCIGN